MTEDPKPKMKFKVVGTAQLSSSGQSLKILIEECERSLFECRPTYINREALVELLHGRRKEPVTCYVREPENPVSGTP